MARPTTQAEGNEEGGFHARSYAIRVRRREFSHQEQRDEHIDRPESEPLNRRAMALRDILILPDKRLRLVSKPVAKIDAATRKLVEDMFETMYDAPGIGLAAIQVGEPKRVVTMDLAKKDEPKEPQVFINPELIWTVRGEEHPRGGLPVDPGILRGGRAAGRRSRSNISISTASSRRSRPTACSPPACSTRSTTSTACCSSTTSPSSSATASSRNSPRRRSSASRTASARRNKGSHCAMARCMISLISKVPSMSDLLIRNIDPHSSTRSLKESARTHRRSLSEEAKRSF